MKASEFARLISHPLLARNAADRYEARHRLIVWIARRAGFRLYNRNLKWIEEDTGLSLTETLERPVEMTDRKRILQSFARSVAALSGDTAECGVFEGASSLVICDAMVVQKDYRHHVFDSFEGLSEPQSGDVATEEKMVRWKKGDLHGPLELVQKNLARFDFVEYHKGWIPDRFQDVADRRFKLVHIDVDLYQPTHDSLAFFYPRMVPGGILLCDDYGSTVCPGAFRAMDEFFSDKPERSVVDLLNGQGFVVVRH